VSFIAFRRPAAARTGRRRRGVSLLRWSLAIVAPRAASNLTRKDERERRRRSFGRSPDDAPPRKIVGYSKSTAEETWGA
jgi:hypothetical protein